MCVPVRVCVHVCMSACACMLFALANTRTEKSPTRVILPSLSIPDMQTCEYPYFSFQWLFEAGSSKIILHLKQMPMS